MITILGHWRQDSILYLCFFLCFLLPLPSSFASSLLIITSRLLSPPSPHDQCCDYSISPGEYICHAFFDIPQTVLEDTIKLIVFDYYLIKVASCVDPVVSSYISTQISNPECSWNRKCVAAKTILVSTEYGHVCCCSFNRRRFLLAPKAQKIMTTCNQATANSFNLSVSGGRSFSQFRDETDLGLQCTPY